MATDPKTYTEPNSISLIDKSLPERNFQNRSPSHQEDTELYRLSLISESYRLQPQTDFKKTQKDNTLNLKLLHFDRAEVFIYIKYTTFVKHIL